MEYKSTLNLPQTNFPMKADLPRREPLFLERWYKEGIYNLLCKKSSGKPKYILHDGPPYANGDIHIGHALNKTLKDIVVKYKTMCGFDSAYVPGWDCHGLPIEHQLFKELKKHKSEVGQLEFRKKAHDYAMKYVSNQREQFKRLGVFGDWDNPYLTLAHDYEQVIIDSFARLFEKGYVYRGLKPVNWCYKCETALAEAEVEYENHTSPSVFVKFKLKDTKDVYLLIWTTTPWTLIANVAVAVHPEFLYSYVETDKGNLIIASDLLAKVLTQAGIEKHELLKEVSGKQLEGMVYDHPFGLRQGKVVLADYVSHEDGSGLVHTAPGHGAEDFLTGLKYKLEIVMPVDTRGRFDQSAKEFAGLNVYEANDKIIEKLKQLGALLIDSKIQHSYPHCWRCKSPVIFRATKQWFLKIDHDSLRQKLLQVIKYNVQWIPPAGKERIAAMVELRPDWCLSRQRYWGVPIPALVCVSCREEFFDLRVIKKFSEFIAKDGTDSWFEKDIKEFTPPGLECPICKGKTFAKGQDILDVWFDSGVSHQAVLKRRPELGGTPCALYLEGSDQHRGWFQSSIIPSMAIDGCPPFKNVLTHGHVVDSQGRKMSKSLGNVVSPHDIIKEYGADVLRLWVASSGYNEDIRISKEMLARFSEAYRKIRNTVRFILSNLNDFNPDINRLNYDHEALKDVDKWIIYRFFCEVLPKNIAAGYESFDFHMAYKGIYDFCNEDLSMRYLDMVKGRLYTFAANSPERRGAQTVMYDILQGLVRVMAPIFVFSAEEIWECMPKEKNESSATSVHMLSFPDSKEWLKKIDSGKSKMSDVYERINTLLGLKPDVDKILEERRSEGVIGSSFDAKIILLTKTQDRYRFLESFKDDLLEIFKVSQILVKIVESFAPQAKISSGFSDIALEAEKAGGQKCARCWNYSPVIGSNVNHPLICDNCLNAIGGGQSAEKEI